MGHGVQAALWGAGGIMECRKHYGVQAGLWDAHNDVQRAVMCMESCGRCAGPWGACSDARGTGRAVGCTHPPTTRGPCPATSPGAPSAPYLAPSPSTARLLPGGLTHAAAAAAP